MVGETTTQTAGSAETTTVLTIGVNSTDILGVVDSSASTAVSGNETQPTTNSPQGSLEKPANIELSSLPVCDNNTKPFDLRPGSQAVCQLDRTPCPNSDLLCITGDNTYGSCCPGGSQGQWAAVSSGCESVAFAVTVIAGTAPEPAKELKTIFVSSVQQCALICFKTWECVSATSAMNPGVSREYFKQTRPPS